MNKSYKICRQKERKDTPYIHLPYSKSISNRLLIIRHLSETKADILNLSDSDDTVLLYSFLNDIETKGNNRFFCKNAGTTTRFLVALLSICEGEFVVDAEQRMQSRPILPLIEILKSLGAIIEYQNKENLFPIRIIGSQLKNNGTKNLDNHLTSQIISALLLISPYIKGGLKLNLPSNQVSLPYINQTISLSNLFGAKIKLKENLIISEESKYIFHAFCVEKDYSALSFIYAFTCVGELEKVIVPNLKQSVLQGDAIAIELFTNLGVETCFEQDCCILSYNPDLVKNKLLVDIKNTPDLFLPLVVSIYAKGIEGEITGIETQRVKESNRIENIARELNKLGERCVVEKDRILIHSGKIDKELKPKFSSYSDHRIVMALCSLGMVCKEIEFDDVSCIEKSWRTFFEDTKCLISQV